ncbi:hypothetical protein V1525DRAFT_409365 [Lipomyces kononenkoae]|uniref:Uncharacterized protein n=1 Tax=Lipomyces kononenkoae TaxID=34357 RepID=A0ACC3SVI4_LIPKO
MGIPTWDSTPSKGSATAKRTSSSPILLPSQPPRHLGWNPAQLATEIDRYSSRPPFTLSRVSSFPTDDEDLEADDIREVEDDDDDRTFGAVDEFEHELEPLGRTYVARQYRLDMARRSRRTQSTPRNERVAPPRTGNSLASELALNSTLAAYVQRLRQLRRLDATAHRTEYEPRSNFHIDDDEEFEEEAREQMQIRDSDRRSDAEMGSSFNSIVEQIRSIGAVHDTALRSNVGGRINTAHPRGQSYHLSPLDLDGFYSSRLRIRRNAFASSARDSELSEPHTSDQSPNNLAEASDTNIRDILHRFEVLDDRIDLIRMARRELRLMEFDTNASLDGMRFAA